MIYTTGNGVILLETTWLILSDSIPELEVQLVP